MAIAVPNGLFQTPQVEARWYVVYTKPCAEDLAGGQLQHKGLVIFIPKIREIHSSVRGEKVKVTPLFPCYLFARMSLPEDYYKVIWAKGVRRVVGSREGPLPLDASVVEFFRRQTGEDGLIRRLSGLEGWGRVRVRKGPLKGLIGVVDGSLDKKGRVRILMNVLREGVRVEVPLTFLERC